MNTILNSVYIADTYFRLSKEDGDKAESDSIVNQKALVREFLKVHPDIQIYKEKVDDGYTGVNFERPAFQEMLEDIKTGRVNCVIVKDLSRFGRNYIEAGRYIEKIFPYLGVRFIAINDNIDTASEMSAADEMLIPFKNLINDAYCRDISVKVKAQQQVKRLEGKCISAFAVYGYRKDPDDKNALMIDEYAADVVRKIFAWKIAGMSMAAIADKLNQSGVLSPMEYKKSLGMKYYTGFGGDSPGKWAAVSVKRVLENQVYIGTMVQGKEEKVSYKLKKRINKPREEWIYVKNTHEAIISEVEFRTVQDLLKYDGRKSEDSDCASLFSGILTCGDCRTPMIRRVNHYKGREKVFYICQTKNRSLGCSRHSIREEQLKQIVFKEIRVWLELMASYSGILEYLEELNINYDQVVEYDSQIGALSMEYKKYCDLKNGLHIDLKEGLIDRKEFDELYCLYERKCEGLETSINAQKKIIKDMFRNGVAAKTQLDRIRETLEIHELTRELLVTTVRRIYVFEDKRLEIEFRFANEMEKLALMRKLCHEKSAVQEVI